MYAEVVIRHVNALARKKLAEVLYKQIGIKIEKVDAETAAKLTAEAIENERAYYENEDPIRIRFKEASAEELL